jgi:signal transduction histidine kinase
MDIIRENVQRLRQQTQEYRKLSLLREDSMETVSLDQYVDQALDMLSVAIQNRDVRVNKSYADDCDCVLINGTALARTFLDLILGAVRSIKPGGELNLTLEDVKGDHVAFELSHAGTLSNLMGLPEDSIVRAEAGQESPHPGMQLARRTVHSCGGSLTIDEPESGGTLIRIVLPRNASNLTESGAA